MISTKPGAVCVAHPRRWTRTGRPHGERETAEGVKTAGEIKMFQRGMYMRACVCFTSAEYEEAEREINCSLFFSGVHWQLYQHYGLRLSHEEMR